MGLNSYPRRSRSVVGMDVLAMAKCITFTFVQFNPARTTIGQTLPEPALHLKRLAIEMAKNSMIRNLPSPSLRYGRRILEVGVGLGRIPYVGVSRPRELLLDGMRVRMWRLQTVSEILT